MRRYVDTELRWLARGFVIPPLMIAFAAITGFRQDIWWGLGGLPLFLVLESILPAYKVSHVAPMHLVLRNGVRRIHVTPQTLLNVKGIYEGQWRAHVSVRTRRRAYIEIRVWKFEESHHIAETLLAIADQGGSYVQPSARRILDKSISQS